MALQYYQVEEPNSWYYTPAMEEYIASIPNEVFPWVIFANAFSCLICAVVISRLFSDQAWLLGLSGAALCFIFCNINFYMVSGHPEGIFITDMLISSIVSILGIWAAKKFFQRF